MRARTKEDLLSLVGQLDHIMKALRVTVEEAEAKEREFSTVIPTPFELRGLGSLLHDFYTWKRIRPLLENLHPVYQQFTREVAAFRSFLMRLAGELD